ncbi:MAG: hypothetical protein JSV19_08035 [Phycisphaerales bacterium]|nr:MAG: hypothetical protein JSV19_08035 [Phycisphaerales bacterium]
MIIVSIQSRGRGRPPRRIASRPLCCLVTAFAVSALLPACRNEPAPVPPSTRPTSPDRFDPSGSTPQAVTQEAPSSGQQLPLPKGHPPLKPNEPLLPPGHVPLSAGDAAGSVPTTQPGTVPGMPVPAAGGDQTVLDGITLTVPQGWQPQDPKPMHPKLPELAPKAVFHLATGPSDLEPVMVRVSHFANMRGMPGLVQQNLQRWSRTFTQPDGRPTSDTVVVETFEAGGCRITVAHLQGSLGALPGQAMIGAIIEHPKGPFFVKASGSAAGVERWKPSILAYLKSAAPSE